MRLEAAACTHVGMRRRVNEDRFAIAPELSLYLVADGMGGHTAGQLASELATSATLRAIRSLRDRRLSLAETLRQAVACANHEIFMRASSEPSLTGMGTTLVAILASRGRAALAHVGDSRAYLVRAGRIRRLTDDHSLVGELVRRREISEDAARAHPHRHVLTRALGVRSFVEPDLAELTPLLGDVFAMCSDGLTAHVRDEEIAEVVRGEGTLEETCQALVQQANDRGGEDNTTVVLVRFDKGDDEAP
jgi:serine/threonine protein phosphatase PrpC